MKAALHEQRTGAAAFPVGEPETTEIAHTGSVLVTLINDDVLGRPQPSRKFEIAGMGAHQQQRFALLVHGMQVQQPIRIPDERKQLPRAAPLDGARIGDPPGGPLAVEVFLDKPGRIERGRVEPVERGKIAERHREAALPWTHAGFEQPLHGPGPAKLIAMDERRDHRATAGNT